MTDKELDQFIEDNKTIYRPVLSEQEKFYKTLNGVLRGCVTGICLVIIILFLLWCMITCK